MGQKFDLEKEWDNISFKMRRFWFDNETENLLADDAFDMLGDNPPKEKPKYYNPKKLKPQRTPER